MIAWREPSPSARSSDLLVRVAKGLSHPARAAIIEQLADGRPRTAGNLMRESGLARSTVSEHLRILRDAGVLTARRDGPRVWYRLDDRVVLDFARSLESLVARLGTVGT